MRRDASRPAVAVAQLGNPIVLLNRDDSLLGRHYAPLSIVYARRSIDSERTAPRISLAEPLHLSDGSDTGSHPCDWLANRRAHDAISCGFALRGGGVLPWVLPTSARAGLLNRREHASNFEWLSRHLASLFSNRCGGAVSCLDNRRGLQRGSRGAKAHPYHVGAQRQRNPAVGHRTICGKCWLPGRVHSSGTNADMQRNLQSGIELGILGYQSPAVMAEQNVANVKIIAGEQLGGQNLIMRKGIDVKSGKDLEGKRIGRPPGSYVTILFTLAAKKMASTLRKSVRSTRRRPGLPSCKRSRAAISMAWCCGRRFSIAPSSKATVIIRRAAISAKLKSTAPETKSWQPIPISSRTRIWQ